MSEWGQQARATAERILGQTAALLAQRGDQDAQQLLRAVRRLEFEQTSDGFTDETNWHDYYWAAVFYVDHQHAPRFTDDALNQLLPALAEVARQNGTDHVDRIHLRPHLPEVTADWRTSPESASAPGTANRENNTAEESGRPDPSVARITSVTRRRLFDALRAAGTRWPGSLDEITFLRRLYDLDALESTDSRFPTAEGDIVQHRYNNPEDWEDDWIFTDPRFQLAEGPDELLLRFLAEMLHPAVRSDDEEVERLLALFNSALGRDGYRLAPDGDISGYPVYAAHGLAGRPPVPDAVSPSVPVAAPAPDGQTAGVRPAGLAGPGVDPVRTWARGERKDYNCPRQPLPDGGQADVFRAVHKPTGTVVALKKLHQRHPSERQVARMRREIEIGRRLEGHPHAMPVLDFGADHTWFVMPWAEATAEMRRSLLQEPEELRGLVEALAAVLSEAHSLGWLHRDIKPSNILHFGGRWRLADWGIVRRPRGQTTKVGRTGPYLGTEGFAAPELSEDPHGATYASDIYSIGRVIAWAVTGEMPRANVPLLPPQPGPWRTITRAATHHDPQSRPQTVADLLALVERELADTPQDPLEHAENLMTAARTGAPAAVEAFLALLTDHVDDYELYVDLLPQVPPNRAAANLARDQHGARTVLRALAGLVDGNGTRTVQFGEAATVVTWLHAVAAAAAGRKEWDLLEEAAQAMCTWDGAWDQWRAQDKIRPWLESLHGDAAAAVASVLRDHPHSAGHFSGLAANRRTDPRIRQAVADT